jgi:hypothetical protein
MISNLKFRDFRAEATVLGKTRSVCYGANSCLVIEDLSVEEAMTIIGLLTGSGVSVGRTVEVPVKDPDRFVAAVTAAVADAKAQDPEPPKADKPKAAKAAPKRETKPAPEPVAEAQAEPAVEATPEPTPEPEKPKAAAKPAAPAKPKEAPPPPDGFTPIELSDAIQGTSSMRDLLTYLAENGVKTVDDLVAQCQHYKAQVPILGKVSDVDQRVRRAAEVLGLFATAEA